MENQLNQLTELNIVHLPVKIEWKNNKKDYMPKYKTKDKPLTTINRTEITNANGTFIPTGEWYDLICIDIDNKDDTVNEFCEYALDNNVVPQIFETTMSGGFHLYYRLNDKQKKKLATFSQSLGSAWAINGWSIDIKYNNCFMFGPTITKKDGNIVKTELHVYNDELETLPNIFFDEIYRIAQSQKKHGTVPNEIHTCIQDYKIPIKTVDNTNDKVIYDILNKLDYTRFSGHTNFFMIMQIIHNCGGSKDLMLKIANERGNKPTKRTLQVENNYKFLDIGKGCTMATLLYMLKMDAREDYKQASDTILSHVNIDNAELKKFISNINDTSASALFYSLYPDKYLFDAKMKEWHKVNKYGIWEKQDGFINIDKDINDMYEYVKAESVKLKLTEFEEKFVEKLTNQLQNDTPITKIHNRLVVKYSVEDLHKKMNIKNGKLLAFTNGVYEFATKKFRNALPKEYINVTTGYDYSDDVCEIKKQELLKILLDIFDTEEKLRFVTLVYILGFSDRNAHSKILFHIGKGGNGKSIMGILMNRIFGDFSEDKLSASYIYEHKVTAKDKTDSILANLQHKKLVCVLEAEKKLDVGVLKDMSGGTMQSATLKFKNEATKFLTGYLLHIQSNVFPELNGKVDNALMRRFIMITYKNLFVDYPEEPNERQLDPHLGEKIMDDYYTKEMLQLALEIYHEYLDNGKKLIIPKDVKYDTTQYFASESPVDDFLLNGLIKVTDENRQELIDKDIIKEGKEPKIKASTLYNLFSVFFKGKKSELMSMKAFLRIVDDKDIKSVGGGKNAKYYIGYVHNNTEDDDDE